MVKPELSIESQLQELDYQLAITKCCFNLYQTIALNTSALDAKDYENFAKYFTAYFLVEKTIISQALFIQLHKFFDQQYKAIKVSQLINNIQNEDEREIINKKYKSLFYKHKTVIANLRHKVYAHTERRVLPEDVFAKIEQQYTKAGVLLRGVRHREGLTQIKMAKKIQVTQADLSKMESGKRPIGKAIAKRIQKIFGVNYRYFL